MVFIVSPCVGGATELPLLPVDPSLAEASDIIGLSSLLASTAAGSDSYGWGKAASTVIAEGLPPIPVKVLDKIRRWEFIDLTLLVNDPGAKSELSSLSSERVVLFQTVDQAQKRKKHISDILTWTQAFAIYMAALASANTTSKEEVVGLMAHLHLINQLSKDMGGNRWLKYDHDFREWAAAKGIRKWGELNLSLYGRCLSFQQSLGSHGQSEPQHDRTGRGDGSKNPKGKTSRSSAVKGACFKWNFEYNCEKADCRFRHVCYSCGDGHRVGDCPRAAKRPRVGQ